MVMRAATFLTVMLGAGLAAYATLLPAAEPAPALAPPEVRAGVEAVVRRMSAMYGDVKGPQAIELFDRNEPMPMYLAEEEPDWIVGWEALDRYFRTPERFAVVEAMDMNPSNIRVKVLGPDLALATWEIFAEMKFRRGPPMGERLRANALLRNTADGWRFIYYAEAPKSTLAYVRDMYEGMATPEFRQRFQGTAAP
jgi:hypothetical protein